MEDNKLEKKINEAERKLAYTFKDRRLLSKALTHSSFANEQGVESNERLEFLGDAVLELSVSREIYRRYPTATEGDMTSLRSRLVNEASLASLARETGLGDCLFLGKGEMTQGGGQRNSVLSDLVEAVLSAIFLDSGYEKADECILRLFQKKWPKDITSLAPQKDYKSRLQEMTQKLFKERPVYSLVDSFGPEHSKIYRVRVTLPDGNIFETESGNMKKGEQEAAFYALEHLGKKEE